jgi:ribosome-associated protein
LRFDIARSSLPERYKQGLLERADRRISRDGILTIKAQRFRTQERNREDAIARLCELIASSGVRSKPRLKTRPTAAARKRRLEDKKTARRSQVDAARTGWRGLSCRRPDQIPRFPSVTMRSFENIGDARMFDLELHNLTFDVRHEGSVVAGGFERCELRFDVIDQRTQPLLSGRRALLDDLEFATQALQRLLQLLATHGRTSLPIVLGPL